MLQSGEASLWRHEVVGAPHIGHNNYRDVRWLELRTSGATDESVLHHSALTEMSWGFTEEQRSREAGNGPFPRINENK